MDERTREKLSVAVRVFLTSLLRIADEENYDRDSFVKASADIFATLAEISTFEHFLVEDGDGDG